MALTINRTRSPKYPNYSLRTAVNQIAKIHTADRRNVIERLNAAKHMGYSGLSGPSEKSIGTLVQYGLLELVGKGQVRVSQLAVDILHPVTEADRKAALAKAAFRPEIFKSLREQFPDGVSEASLQSYLVRNNFMDRAISPLSKAYTETCLFLEQSGATDSGRQGGAEAAESSSLDDDEEMAMETATATAPPARTVPPAATAPSFGEGLFGGTPLGANDIKVMLDGSHLRVAAYVDIKGAKRLMKALRANIALLSLDDDDDEDEYGRPDDEDRDPRG
jgi:hypothetical protein